MNCNCSKYLLVIITLQLLIVPTAAQVTDTLREVKIKARKEQKIANDERLNTFSPGLDLVAIDTVHFIAYEFQDMATLLAQQVPVFVKSYGINNLATLNFRGASAAQSQVYWNGVPVQNAALGIADVSLLPVGLMNRVNVVYGSSSSLWGSGNVGGALMVENDLPEFDADGSFTQSVSAVAGSFGHYRFGLKSDLSTKKFAAGINLFGQSLRNDFTYNRLGIEQQMENAALRSGVGLVQAGYKINDNNSVSFKGWYQQYYREIPPALFEAYSVKNQRDESLRLLLDWQRKGDKTDYYTKLSYIRDNMHYRDSAISLESKNIANQLYGEAGINHYFNKNHRLLVFIPIQLSWLNNPQTIAIVHQNRYALAGAYLFTGIKNKLNVSVSMRGEVVDDNSYLLPGLNAAYYITNWLKIRGNMQRTYRVPTLNELYYIPGGNPNLKPEQGWNQDIGYDIKEEETSFHIKHSLSFYNRNIDDWILWFGGAIWTPHNIATVHSRGLQTANSAEYLFRKILFKLSGNFQYTLATTEASYLPGDGSIGMQIPYTPRYQGQANFSISWKEFYINYNHTYTGLRYITTDESFSIAAYQLGNVQFIYGKDFGDNTLRFTLQCNNIWNREYQVVNARPMPGINFLAGLSFALRN